MSLKQNSKAGKKFIKHARNVLALPKDSFWPTIEDDDSEFRKRLEQTLKCAKTFHPKLPWAEVKKLSKSDRKIKIEKLIQDLPPDELEAHKKGILMRKYLSLGVNDVCRSLEKEELVCCLISGKAKPKLLLTHLIDLAKVNKIPILVLDSLKDNVKYSLGFSALAVGFKKEILLDVSHDFHALCNEMLGMFNEKYSYDLTTNLGMKSDNFEANFETKALLAINSEKKEICSQIQLTFKDIYLYRESNKYRVFKPCGTSGNITTNEDLNENEEMKMTVEFSEEEYGVVNKKGRYYQPPAVLRVQINPNKIRKNKKKKKT